MLVILVCAISILADDELEQKRAVKAFSTFANWDEPLLLSQDWLGPLDKLRIIANTMRHGTKDSRRAIELLQSANEDDKFATTVDDLYEYNKVELKEALKAFSSSNVLRLVSNHRSVEGHSHFTPLESIIRRYARGIAMSPVYRQLTPLFRSLPWEQCQLEGESCINACDPRNGVIGTRTDQSGNLLIRDFSRRGPGLRINTEKIFPSDQPLSVRLIPGLRVWCMCNGREARLYTPDSFQKITDGQRLQLIDFQPSNAGNLYYAFIDASQAQPNLFICSDSTSRVFPFAVDSIDGDVAECLDFMSRPIIPSAERAGSWPDRQISTYISLTDGRVVDDTDKQLLQQFRSLCQLVPVCTSGGKRGELSRICQSIKRGDDALPLIKEFIRGKPYGPEALRELVNSVLKS